MLVNVRQLREGESSVKVSATKEQVTEFLQEADDFYGEGEPLEFELKLRRYGDTTKVTGVIELNLNFMCARCAAERREAASYEVDWTLLPISYLKSDKHDEEIELSTEDLDISFLQDDEVNLLDILREVLLLELPQPPYCPLDACEPNAYLAAPVDESANEQLPDPRWAALSQFKKSDN